MRQGIDICLQAAADLRYLLDRGYPKDASLILVGNRYGLDRDHRHLLHRAVVPTHLAAQRKAKTVDLGEIRGRGLAIDGHNTLITLESAILGKTIFLADDGFLRDISSVSASYRHTQVTDRALELIMKLLVAATPDETIFLLDAPISGSGRLASHIRGLMSQNHLRGDARAVRVPERHLATYRGIIATSDGALIDAAQEVFDLAGHIIAKKLRTPYIDISRQTTPSEGAVKQKGAIEPI